MRRSGITTRKINDCVEELFTGGVTFLQEDESSMVSARIRSARTLQILKQRLYLEHDISQLECIWDDYGDGECFRICIIQ
jgi:hypothetical protein